jgi:hypothetical protein
MELPPVPQRRVRTVCIITTATITAATTTPMGIGSARSIRLSTSTIGSELSERDGERDGGGAAMSPQCSRSRSPVEQMNCRERDVMQIRSFRGSGKRARTRPKADMGKC